MRHNNRKPINIEIGQNIRKYRELYGYSRETFAELIDVSPRFIANIEVGDVGISPTTLKKICEALFISADRILWSTEEPITVVEQAKHIPKEYLPYVNQCLLGIIGIIHKEQETKKELSDNS